MRNISFALTKDQFRNRSKTVTRRKGWASLKAGTLLMGCEKCMGLKKGEKISKLGVIRVLDVRLERLDCILNEANGASNEGFPEMTNQEFVDFFCSHMKGNASQLVTRIEFEYV